MLLKFSTLVHRLFNFSSYVFIKCGTGNYLVSYWYAGSGQNVVRFEVALGYRDGIKGPWQRMTAGNVTRSLNCWKNDKVLVILCVLSTL